MLRWGLDVGWFEIFIYLFFVAVVVVVVDFGIFI